MLYGGTQKQGFCECRRREENHAAVVSFVSVTPLMSVDGVSICSILPSKKRKMHAIGSEDSQATTPETG